MPDQQDRPTGRRRRTPSARPPASAADPDRSRRLARAKQLIERHGLTPGEAARVAGVPKSSIYVQLRGLTDPEAAKAWRDRKADILDDVARQFIQTLTPSLIKDLIRRRGLVDFGIVFDKAQLAAGKATANVDVRHYLEMHLGDLQARRAALRQQLADAGLDPDRLTASDTAVIDVSPCDMTSHGTLEAGPGGLPGGGPEDGWPDGRGVGPG